ncbi:hypothetical protein P154DRAFT_618890 [Amniculicola lignicola CBS 123094]|uniref:Helicase ATP-binding domain-containing protein n=1 Tax=Amniculicola lignicola CBS 123094 TaxID=1392246 RepID=A0A6A5WJZ4_9PLEO|nr:hypothetical protein P154DRAFT_618890 [Amniculicola lignicola CBS 123094]
MAGKKKKKTAASRHGGSTAADRMLEPGMLKTPSSFINIENPELTIAAYCGFKNLGVFRRFYLSDFVLPFFNAFTEYKGYSRKHTLGLLEEAQKEVWDADEDVRQKFPLTKDVDTAEGTKTQLNYGVGLIAWQLLRTVRKGVLASGTDTDAERKKFEQTTKQALPPLLPFPAEHLPNLGPHDGETHLEALNRVLCLFQHMRHVIMPLQWGRRFNEPKQWDASSVIGPEWVPRWMRQVEEDTSPPSSSSSSNGLGELPDESTPTSEKKTAIESRPVNIKWKKQSQMYPQQKKYLAFLEDSDVLDSIKTEVVITIPNQNTPGGHGPEKSFPALKGDWEEILAIVFNHKANDPAVYFTCLFMERGDGVSPWEFNGPPPMFEALLEAVAAKKQHAAAAAAEDSANDAEQVQQTIFQMSTPDVQSTFDPLTLFRGDKERMIRFYDGFDVSTPQRRLQWQMKFLPRLAGEEFKYINDEAMAAFKKLSHAQQEALTAASAAGADHAVDVEDERDNVADGEARYYAFETAAGGGTQSGVGPPIETSAQALLMTREDVGDDELYAFGRWGKDKIDRTLKPWQVNGAAWALSVLYGKIPLCKGSSEEAKHAVLDLSTQQIPGIIMSDQTGLGKTIMLLATLVHCNQPVAPARGKKPIFKPLFLAVPQNLLRAWAREILQHWPIFTLVLSYDDGTMDPFLAEHIVSASAKLAHDFSHDAGETHSERTLIEEKIELPGGLVQKTYKSRLERCFSVVCVDEATKIKTVGSKRQMSISLLKPRRCVFVTATPMINQGVCILGPLSIIWETTERYMALVAPEDVRAWVTDQKGSPDVYDRVDQLARDGSKENSLRRLAVLNPWSAKVLLESGDRPLISKNFPMVEDLIMLRRTKSSRIPRDKAQSSYCDIRATCKKHFMQTSEMRRTDDEEAEFQYLYRDAAMRFIYAKGKNKKTRQGLATSSLSPDQKAVFGVAEMRELIIISGSTRAALFNLLCNQLNSNTLVNTLGEHRRGNLAAFDIVKMMCQATDQPVPTTASAYAEFMVHGSPMLRGLIHEIHMHLGNAHPGKILITEDIPLLAWWWELTLNLILFHTSTYHGALSASDRDKLAQDFNSPTAKLQAMVLPYDVGALGLNLQRDCSKVVVMSCGKNHGIETQATFRTIRVSHKQENSFLTVLG